MVPRPPIFRRPKRAKGAEQIVMLGVTFRMAMTDDGSEGINLEVMLGFSTGTAGGTVIWSEVNRYRRLMVENRGVPCIYGSSVIRGLSGPSRPTITKAARLWRDGDHGHGGRN